jgi:fructosamine-3-kinase
VEAGLGAAVADARPVAGGCISPSWRVRLADGRTVFIKTAPAGVRGGLLLEESRSLQRLSAAGVVRVPGVLLSAAACLVLEWLPPAPPTPAAWRALGGALARLHGVTAASYGWDADNWIGSLPQHNLQTTSWAEFWVERRLRPQFASASAQLSDQARRDAAELLRAAAALLDAAEADGASLLHGDLWSGNVHMSTDGPALIDPSSYFGHREVDLAMADLFGGFAAGFWQAYEAEWPLLPDWRARRALYQLYYLLVHVNLFGGGYVAQTERALRAALAVF